MRWTRNDAERVAAINRSYWLAERCAEAIKKGRASDCQSFHAQQRAAEQAQHYVPKRDGRALAVRAYVKKDAEARWLLDRDTPGAFAAARAENRLRVLSQVPVCSGCDGQGFCQCDPLPASALRGAAGPEFD